MDLRHWNSSYLLQYCMLFLQPQFQHCDQNLLFLLIIPVTTLHFIVLSEHLKWFWLLWNIFLSPKHTFPPLQAGRTPRELPQFQRVQQQSEGVHMDLQINRTWWGAFHQSSEKLCRIAVVLTIQGKHSGTKTVVSSVNKELKICNVCMSAATCSHCTCKEQPNRWFWRAMDHMHCAEGMVKASKGHTCPPFWCAKRRHSYSNWPTLKHAKMLVQHFCNLCNDCVAAALSRIFNVIEMVTWGPSVSEASFCTIIPNICMSLVVLLQGKKIYECPHGRGHQFAGPPHAKCWNCFWKAWTAVAYNLLIWLPSWRLSSELISLHWLHTVLMCPMAGWASCKGLHLLLSKKHVEQCLASSYGYRWSSQLTVP